VLKTLRQRLRGKEGRIRGNLMGKRVDYTGRTVITADPNLQIDQVGVPRSIALNLTVPERVTSLNRAELQKLVENGPDVHPGARYIQREDGSRVDLRFAPSTGAITLNPGWTVDRHLRDNDIILFNRQPSLHKMSIMGHRVKVLDWSTFRLNLSVTTPYNADFDGDEMNLHAPQTLTARAEAEQMMMVPRNIVTPQSNAPVMGIVQDSLLGTSRLTRRDTFVEWDVVMNIIMWVNLLGKEFTTVVPKPAIFKPRPLWTGKQIFSMILPKVNLRGGNNLKAPKDDELNSNDSEVLIEDGQVLMGVIDKKTVGTAAGGLVHVTWLDAGWKETARFMIQVQQVVNYWFLQNSFTIGVRDTVADARTLQDISKEILETKKKVQGIMEDAQQGRLEPQPGQTIFVAFEYYVNKLLNSLTEKVGEMARNSVDYTNNIIAMILGGSKGNNFNITQIMCCLGQQNVEGKRVSFGFSRRTLPHFSKDDYGPESRGFVENSYLKGLTPQEFFFHAMGGREGCIDTAVKTAEVGYIQRRLVKFMESVMARYDRSVRTARGSVVQFLYGEDGMDAVWVERQHLSHLKLSEDEFRKRYYIRVTDPDFGRMPGSRKQHLYLAKAIIEDCRQSLSTQTLLDEELAQLLADRKELAVVLKARQKKAEEDTYLPINLARLIWVARRMYRISDKTVTDLHPKTVVERIRALVDDVIVVPGEDKFSVQAQSNATIMFKIMLRATFATKRVLYEYRFNELALNYVTGQIREKFQTSQVMETQSFPSKCCPSVIGSWTWHGFLRGQVWPCLTSVCLWLCR
jgi:DNA-directed RNA polymerase II subunit RPB1